MRPLHQRPSLPYVLPFGALVLSLFLPRLGVGVVADNAIRITVVGVLLVSLARPVLDLRVTRWAGSIGVGVLVFLLWIGPDLLVAGYRENVLFSNAVVGRPESAFPEAAREDAAAVALRFARAVLVVPVAEELFWRAWLPRWIVNPDFRQVPLGRYTRTAFAITAVLFAVEHGSYWDVGLAAGVGYNLWMIRTRSLGDCVVAHAVTNACLGAYVIGAGQWQYW
jgi:CAAX prenyl protease-like protein